MANMEDVDYINTLDNRSVSLDVFVDPACMDFGFKGGEIPKGFPEIPFDQIGLHVDQYRPSVPNKDVYRRAVKANWDDRKCYDDKVTYDPETITELIYFNTGKLLFAVPPKP